jgi:(p)ppGpp synthase/HD superfamily hydrolase
MDKLLLMAKLTKAFNDAAVFHVDQKRKSRDVYYLSHLMGVASKVMKYGGSVDTTIAGLLHDLLEDQGEKVDVAYLEKNYGKEVADMVVSSSEFTEHVKVKEPWKVRKDRYIAHIKTKTPEQMLICAADKLDNLEDIIAEYDLMGSKVWDMFTAEKSDTIWFYNAVYEELKACGFKNNIMLAYKRKLDELNVL